MPVAGDIRQGVRRVVQWIVLGAPLALFDPRDLVADGQHGVDETIQFGFGLAFGRLDHQGAGHREGHGRRMETEIHQPLGDILLGNARGRLDRPNIDDAFVGHPTVTPAVKHRIGFPQAPGYVVGIEDRHLGGLAQSAGAHQRDVGPTDRQDAGTAPGRGADRIVFRVRPVQWHHHMVGQIRCQVCLDADRPHAGPTAAMGDAEGLVQVHVRDVGAKLRRPRQPHQGIEVGAVHVHLAAVLVDDIADLANTLFIHAMGRGIGDHQAGQVGGVLGGLAAQVLHIDVALLIAGHQHHAHAGHHRRGRVGAVGGGRNQADSTMPVTRFLMIFADRQQPGVFALGAGVGLHADGIETGDRPQHGFQLIDHGLVACRLGQRSKGMQAGEFRPGDGNHLAGGIQLHGAGTQRNHRVVERQVLVFQRLDVAQHGSFRAVPVEYRVRQNRRLAQELVGYALPTVGDRPIQFVQILVVIIAGETAQQRCDRGGGSGFVQSHAQMVGIDQPQVDALAARAADNRTRLPRHVQRQGIEEVAIAAGNAAVFQAGSEHGGQSMHPQRDRPQPFRAMVDRIEAGDIGQQHLGGADVGVGLFPTDMLLAGLQRHAQRPVAAGIHRDADDAPRHGPLVGVAGGEEGRMGPAVAHGHAKALGGAEYHIGTQLAGRRQQHQAQRVRRHAGQPLLRLHLGDQRREVADLTPGGGVLEHRAEDLLLGQHIDRIHQQFEAEGLGAGADHRDGLRVTVLIDKEPVALALGHPPRQGHGFRGGGSLVEQRRVGQLHAGQIQGHLLEIEQRLQSALGDFRLVGRIGGIPAGIFQHVAQDHRRCDGVVVTHADAGGEDLVAAGQSFQVGQHLGLATRLIQRQRPVHGDALGQGLCDQLRQRRHPQSLEHALLFRRIRTDMAADEGVRLFQFTETRGMAHGLTSYVVGLLTPSFAAQRQRPSYLRAAC